MNHIQHKMVAILVQRDFVLQVQMTTFAMNDLMQFGLSHSFTHKLPISQIANLTNWHISCYLLRTILVINQKFPAQTATFSRQAPLFPDTLPLLLGPFHA